MLRSGLGEQLLIPSTFFKESSAKLVHQWFIGSQNVTSANLVPKFWIISIYFLILTSCFFGTIINFVCSDFSIYNTFITSTADVPLFYKISATWSNHEGSLLLWCWLLSLNIFLFCVSVNKKINSINTLKDQSFSSFLLSNQQLLTHFRQRIRKTQKMCKASSNLFVIFNHSGALTKNQQKELVLYNYATIVGGPPILWSHQNRQKICTADAPTNLCLTKLNNKKTLLFQNLNLLEQQYLRSLTAMVKQKFFKHLFWDQLTSLSSSTFLKGGPTSHRRRSTEKLSFLILRQIESAKRSLKLRDVSPGSPSEGLLKLFLRTFKPSLNRREAEVTRPIGRGMKWLDFVSYFILSTRPKERPPLKGGPTGGGERRSLSNLKLTGSKKEPIGIQLESRVDSEIEKRTYAFCATRFGFEQQSANFNDVRGLRDEVEPTFGSKNYCTFAEGRPEERFSNLRVSAHRAFYITNVLHAGKRVRQPLNKSKASLQFKYLELITKTIFIISIILLFFTTFLVYTSNPFMKIASTPCIVSLAELNPILQDPVLAIHPPCIYTGYVASAIAFSLSLFYWKKN